MSRIPGVNHQDAVRALQKAGFRVARQGKHIVITDGVRILTIPRHNPVNTFSMGGIVHDAGSVKTNFARCCSLGPPNTHEEGSRVAKAVRALRHRRRRRR